MVLDFNGNDDEEQEEITEEQLTYIRIDRNESRIRRSALAYLMVQSGQIFATQNGPSSTMRGQIIDDMGVEALSRLEEMEVPVNEQTLVCLQSLFSQIAQSENPNIPIISIDVSAIASNLILPLNQPDETTLELPRAIRNMGITFTSWDDLRESFNNLASNITTAPKNTLFWLQKFERMFIDIADPAIAQRAQFHRIKPEWRFCNPPDHCDRTFQQLLHAVDVGRLVKVKGQVTEVGDIKVVLTHVAFRCVEKNDLGLECGTITLTEQREEEHGLQKPNECPICQKDNFVKLDSRESKSESMQRIMIQEEDITNEARTIMVELRGSICNMDLAGSSIEVTGMMRVEPISKNSTIHTPYILGSNYTISDSVDTEMYLSSRDLREIEEFMSSMGLEERMKAIINGWSPRIHGVDDIRSAIILQVIGCPEENSFVHRPGIHVLIMGDPGTVKSKLLKLSIQLRNGSRYCHADAASQAGLTGGCSQVEDLYTGKKRWAVIPGEIPLTHPDGICAIDEFNLYKGDFGDFNTAMESGEVVVTKIAKARIKTKCSILAAANPKSKDSNRKKFNKNNQIPYSQQIGLEFTTMQRFDAIFIIEDTANEGHDRQIARNVLGSWVEDDEIEQDDGRLSMDFIRKFIAHCRSLDVTLSPEVVEYMADIHAKKRQEAQGDEELRSHRQVPSLARFTMAAARFDGVPVATLEHVRYAEKLLENTLQERDPGVVDGGMSGDARLLRSQVAENFVELISSGFMFEGDKTIVEIYSEMKKTWSDIPDMDKVERVMESFAQNKNVTSIYRRRDGTYSYDGNNNPAYQWW